MTRENLSFVADALLALCEKDEHAPFYGDEAFRLKVLAGRRRDPKHAHLVMGRHGDTLLQAEWADVFRLAKLTVRQNDVVSQRLDGFTFEEIGRHGGHTKQGARQIFVQALKKLVRA